MDLAVHRVRVFCEREKAAKQRGVHMTIYHYGRMFRQHCVQRILIVHAALEGRAHGKDHQGRASRFQRFFQFFRNHAAVHIGRNENQIEVLQIRQPHIGIMGRVRHIHDGLLSRLFLQVFSPEVNAMVIAVRTAERNEAPEVLHIKAVIRRNGFDDFPFKFQRVQITAVGVERVARIVGHRLIRAAVNKPSIKSFQRYIMICRIT